MVAVILLDRLVCHPLQLAHWLLLPDMVRLAQHDLCALPHHLLDHEPRIDIHRDNSNHAGCRRQDLRLARIRPANRGHAVIVRMAGERNLGGETGNVDGARFQNSSRPRVSYALALLVSLNILAYNFRVSSTTRSNKFNVHVNSPSTSCRRWFHT